MKSFKQYISEIFTPPKEHIKGGYHPDLGYGGSIAHEPDRPHHYYNKEHGTYTRGVAFDYSDVPEHMYHEVGKYMKGVNIEKLHSGRGAKIDFSTEEDDLSRPGKKVQVYNKAKPGKTFPSHVTRTVFDHVHHFIHSHNVNHIFYETGDDKKDRLYQRAAKRLGVGATNIIGTRLSHWDM